MPQTVSALAPFHNRLYLVYWLTGLSANFGWLIQVVGASWLMTVIGGSPEMVALVQTALALPTMLFSLAAGAMADNFGRRTMILWSQSFLLLISVLLAAFSYTDSLTPLLLLGFTFLIGSGKALNNPAWQTLVREFMPHEEMPAAIALNSVGFNIARTVGPAIGGAIVAAVGAFAAFVVNAISNLGMILVFLRWRRPPQQSDLPPESVGSAMMAGIRYVTMSPQLLLVMLRALVFNFAAISMMALMPLVARDLVSGGPQTYGVLLGAFGAGAVTGAFLGGRLRTVLSLEGLARLGFAAFAAALLMVGATAHVAFTLAGVALAGASWLLTLSTFNTTVQMSSPRWVVSRCHALYQTASFAGNALGSWVWGEAAGSYGITIALGVSASVLVLGVAMGFLFPLRELDAVGLDPLNRWRSPTMKLDMLPQSGPIATTVEYVIGEEDVPGFLSLMAERRRTRRRDGALRWDLSRDIEQPNCWIESYQTPTWVDTLRHHERRTKADAALGERVRALHRGESAPKARHYLIRRAGWGHTRALPIFDDFSH